MAAENLFDGLPPPSAAHGAAVDQEQPSISESSNTSPLPVPPILPPSLKSALKRNRPPESSDEATPPQKRLRFKTTVDTTEAQVIDAIKKIAAHIKIPSKFNKASKLAIQLIQAGSLKQENGSHFFDLLDAAMSSPTACNESALRTDYHALFSAAQEATQWFSKQQKNIFATWTIRALVANDLYTDDSFVYAKAAGKIKEAILNLPFATLVDDREEAEILDKTANVKAVDAISASPSDSDSEKEASDPFGLDALLPSAQGKKNKKLSRKEVASLNKAAAEEEEEHKRFIRAQREALLLCLEIAARRYKVPWCQTVIDILAKHAFDHADRFTLRQREAIEKLWSSVKEQQIRRKQGKSVSGKLDMNAFEWLQEKYSHEKISIRHSVGGSGERRAEQWLG